MALQEEEERLKEEEEKRKAHSEALKAAYEEELNKKNPPDPSFLIFVASIFVGLIALLGLYLFLGFIG